MRKQKLSVVFFAILGLLVAATAVSGNRKRSIDFEDTLVEGVNKQPLDSLSQISEEQKKNDVRLYRKRAGFKDLMSRTLEELRDLK
jgi:hypothetical protein